MPIFFKNVWAKKISQVLTGNPSINQTIKSKVPLYAIVLSLFLGLLVAVVPWYFVVGLLLVILFVFFTWSFPEYSALILIAGVCGIFPSQLFGHAVTLGTLFGLLLMSSARNLGRSEEWWSEFKPFVLPLCILMFIVLLGAVRSILFLGVQRNYIFDEMLPYLCWLLFPVFVMSLNTSRRLNAFVFTLLIVSAYVAFGQSIQAMFHVPVFFEGRLEEVETLGRSFSGATRSTTAAIFLLLLGLFVCVAMFLVKVRNIMLIPLMLLCVVGLIFTYGRTLMIATALGVLFVSFLLGSRRIFKLGIIAGMVLGIVLGGLSVYKPSTLFALQDRFLSIGSELSNGRSLNYRIVENLIAIPQIIKNPIFGIGLGKEYRRASLLDSGADIDTQTQFIHNGYLYVMLKLGLVTFIAYGIFIAVFFVRARKIIKRLTDLKQKAIAAAAMGLMFMPLLTSFFRPEWMSSSSTAIYAICFGLVVALANLQKQSEALTQQSVR